VIKRIGVLCACMLVASPVAASTLVTWEATGQIDSIGGSFPDFVSHPPVGTPVSLTLTFAPREARPTPTGLSHPTPGCMTVDAGASLTIGGHTWNGNVRGLTQSLVPGMECNPNSDHTQFLIFGLMAPRADIPWDLSFPAFHSLYLLDYRDLLVHDAFPDVPTTRGAHLGPIAGLTGGGWTFSAGLDLRAVNQTTPVPEPGTMVLLGIGLAAAARARRKTLGRLQ
jgi:hypothetical protein